MKNMKESFMLKKNIEDVGKKCPDCGAKLHVGQKKFEDGMFFVEYCKECGFREEDKKSN